MSSMLRTMCRKETSEMFNKHNRGPNTYCQNISRKKGKHRHVSRNTVTPNRMYNHSKGIDVDAILQSKKKLW